MPELVVIVPSRGRPHTVAELAAAFRETCTADTYLLVAFDESDPTGDEYRAAARDLADGKRLACPCLPAHSMVESLNFAAKGVACWTKPPTAIGFCGDDHRPRTKGWDRAYLDALAARPGIVYGNDLIQGRALPTQCAMSTGLVRALGNMAPPVLTHLYLDNYWLHLGLGADCITYLPDVVVEHVHPVTGKVAWDEGHVRVNRPELYQQDHDAFAAYWAEHGEQDVAAARAATGVRA